MDGTMEAHMSKAFENKRSLLWLGGITLLVVGFLVAALVLPATAPTPGSGGPDVRVPKMENVPPEHAPRMKLDVEKKE
jgi:hypothetical protein